MIVFDLACEKGHRFEAWFRSSAAFDQQGAQGLLMCPNCGSNEVTKAPMAPAVSAKGNARVVQPVKAAAATGQLEAPSQGGALPPAVREALEKLAKLQAETIKDSTYVGDKFADESRAMHYGEKDAGLIHGKANAKEVQELIEEGITIAPLLVPYTPPDEAN